jgi:hypothetical protein
VKTEHRLEQDELEILTAYDAGELASVAGKDEIEKLRAAARATGTKDRRGGEASRRRPA